MANLEIIERFENKILILDLKGRIIFGEGSIKLHRILRELVERGEVNILLNFSEAAYIDSSGLGELVGGYVAVKRIGGEIKLFNLSSNVLELIQLTKLSNVFEIYDNETKALESFDLHTSKSVSVN